MVLPARHARAARALRRAGPGLALIVVYALATTLGPTSGTSVNDLFVYSTYGDLLDAGKVPYRDFGFEYPPLALLPIELPRLLGGSYAWTFGLEMLLCALVIGELLRALGGERAAWLWALSPLALGAQVRTHFDLAAVALLVGALLALARDRPRTGFALLGLGGLVKLFPLLLAPVAAAWLLGRGRVRDARDGVLACVAVVAAGTVPFLVTGGLDGMVRFHLDRPVQIESTPASLLFALGGSAVTGAPVAPDPYKSNGLTGGHAGAVLAICTVLLVCVLAAAVAAAAARRPGRRRLLLCCWLAVLAFVALGKVLSPQYMIWLAPFAVLALVAGERAVAIPTIAAIVLTQLWFPSRYFELVDEDTAVVALVALRNALLLTALGATARALARSPAPAAAPARSG